MADDLHARTLAELDRLDPHRLTTLGKVVGAVVERHAPAPGSPRCSGCWEMRPCPDIRLIADQLGLTTEGAPDAPAH